MCCSLALCSISERILERLFLISVVVQSFSRYLSLLQESQAASISAKGYNHLIQGVSVLISFASSVPAPSVKSILYVFTMYCSKYFFEFGIGVPNAVNANDAGTEHICF